MNFQRIILLDLWIDHWFINQLTYSLDCSSIHGLNDYVNFEVIQRINQKPSEWEVDITWIDKLIRIYEFIRINHYNNDQYIYSLKYNSKSLFS